MKCGDTTGREKGREGGSLSPFSTTTNRMKRPVITHPSRPPSNPFYLPSSSPPIVLQISQHQHQLAHRNGLKRPIIDPTIPRPPIPSPSPHLLHHMRHRPPSLPPSLPSSPIEKIVPGEHVQVRWPECALHQTRAVVDPEGN